MRTWCGIKDHPGLMLSNRACPTQLLSERVVWVDLHREAVMDVKELHKGTRVADLSKPSFADRLPALRAPHLFCANDVREPSAAPHARDESWRNQLHDCTTVSAAALRPPLQRLESLRRKGQQS